jgi:succinylglutamate desuccinylase
MINDFLAWTRENEESIDAPFEHSKINNGTLYVHDTGVIEFIPNKETNTQIVLSCAIHGNETAPIEILNSILSEIKKENLQCVHNTLFIFGNPKAINMEKRFCDENLNRLFADGLKDKKENYETKRAKVLIDLLDNFYKKDSFKFHYDLHTAIRDSKISKFAISPFAPQRKIDKHQLTLLKDLSIDAVILGSSPATTFSYHSSSIYNAKSFTLELGKVKKFGENNPADFLEVNKTLRNLINNTYNHNENFGELIIYRIKNEIIKSDDSFDFPFDSKKANFSQFLKGSVIYSENSNEYFSDDDSSFILFPNKNVKLGERAALIITSKDLPI